MIVNLRMGDWSGDGHDKIADEPIKVSTKNKRLLQVQDIKDAYTNGVAKCGIDITQYCDEFEDNKIPLEMVKEINDKLGIDLSDDYTHLYPELYSEIWVAIAKLGDPSLTIEFIPITPINIGGYGLFFL